jgi:hypothetical protein
MSAADRPLTALEEAQARYAEAVRAIYGHGFVGDLMDELTEARDDLLRLEREASADHVERLAQ